MISTLGAAQKGVIIIIEKSGFSLDLGPYSIQLTRLDNMDNLDLTLAKKKKKRVCSVRTFRENVWEGVCTNGLSSKTACSAISRQNQRRLSGGRKQ